MKPKQYMLKWILVKINLWSKEFGNAYMFENFIIHINTLEISEISENKAFLQLYDFSKYLITVWETDEKGRWAWRGALLFYKSSLTQKLVFPLKDVDTK